MPAFGFPSALDTEDDFRGDTAGSFESNALLGGRRDQRFFLALSRRRSR
jgi:hypothetical protein